MLVRGEDLDRFARVLCRLLGNGIRELFLNAAASSGVADFGFFGRGFWIDQPIAFNASQPRCGATEVTLSSPAIQAATLRPAMRWHPHIPQTALPTPRHSNDPRPSPCVPISRLMAPKLICFARPCESLSTSSQSAGNRITAYESPSAGPGGFVDTIIRAFASAGISIVGQSSETPFPNVQLPAIFIGRKAEPFGQFPAYAMPSEAEEWLREHPPPWAPE